MFDGEVSKLFRLKPTPKGLLSIVRIGEMPDERLCYREVYDFMRIVTACTLN